MEIKRKSSAVWNGTGKEGKGLLTSQSGILSDTQYGFQSRFADGIGTNPEELIAAAHAGCFSMKLAFNLQAANYKDIKLTTECEIVFENGEVTQSNLSLTAEIAGIEKDTFDQLVNDAKANCPISKLINCKINLSYKLSS